MVEFAIVLPILALVLFAIIQFGIVFNDYLALTDAVRAGSRVAAVSRNDDPAGKGETAVRKAAGKLDEGDLQVSVTSPAGFSPGSDVVVTASFPYTIDLFGMDLIAGRISSTTTERVE